MNILHNNSRSGKHVPGLGPGLVPGLAPGPVPQVLLFVKAFSSGKEYHLVSPLLRHNTKNTTEKHIFR